jgi:hypothetical protein
MKTLRRSIETLNSPICEVCNIEMDWSRSALIADEQAVLHVFICPRCADIGEAKTSVKNPPE